jgi:hypothetical protein
MNNNTIELIAALDKLSSAANEFEAQAAVTRLKHALSDETTESDREEAQFGLRDKVRESVLSDALADYDEHSELYPERVLTLHNTLPVVMGKIPSSELKEADVLCVKDILPRFGELARCKTGDEIRAFVDNLSARFEQHPEYREAGYRRLLWELEDEIIGAYAEVFFRVADRSWRAGYQMSLLAALEENVAFAYTPDFVYFEDSTFQVITPENLLQETDLTALRKKLDLLRSALARWDVPACSAYLENLLCQISKAILDALRASPEWEESSAATKLRADYLTNLADGLLGLTEAVEEVEDAPPEDNFMNAQMALRKLCAETDAEYLENAWEDFLVFAAACPDVGSLSMQAILSLTVAVLAMDAPDNLPETLQCLIRFFLTASAWPMSFTYNDTVFRWILSGGDAA